MSQEAVQTFNKANEFFQKGDYAKAIQDYGNAIKLSLTGAHLVRAYLHKGIFFIT